MKEAYWSPLLEVILINPLTNIKQPRIIPVFLLRNRSSERVSDFPKVRQLVGVSGYANPYLLVLSLLLIPLVFQNRLKCIQTKDSNNVK